MLEPLVFCNCLLLVQVQVVEDQSNNITLIKTDFFILCIAPTIRKNCTHKQTRIIMTRRSRTDLYMWIFVEFGRSHTFTYHVWQNMSNSQAIKSHKDTKPRDGAQSCYKQNSVLSQKEQKAHKPCHAVWLEAVLSVASKLVYLWHGRPTLWVYVYKIWLYSDAC